jgi:SAM-dependent methyltransferase
MSYAEKLQNFNSTEKYRNEIKILIGLISLSHENAYCLDYGCGIGTAVKQINCNTKHFAWGYDVKKHDQNFRYIDLIEPKKYDVVYFMHSFAHITYPEVVLKQAKNYLRSGGRIIIITPNKKWLSYQDHKDYKPDTTVHKHYNQTDLCDIVKAAGYKLEQTGQFGGMVDEINERIFLIAKNG